ncbi:MAG: twin-arginine translocation signal domain-containing protein [Bryobacteraceae bacterium]
MTDKVNGTKDISRRGLLRGAAASAAAFAIVPRHVLGRGFVPPSDKVTMASMLSPGGESF